jgi:glutathione S-transferase
LAGKEFTAVDAFYAPVVLRVQTYVGVWERLGEASKGYAARMLELEGVREWVADALRETGREVLHDEESLEGPGKRLLEDLRERE